MSSFYGKKLPPISDSQRFETFIAALWERRYPGSSTTLVGRPGQKQFGLDVLVRTQQGWRIGIQCKAMAEVKEKLLRDEVGKAGSSETTIDEFVLVTTAPHDAPLVMAAQRLSQENCEKGLFPVSVFGWGELERLVEPFPDLVRQFYPEFIGSAEQPSARAVLEVDSELSIPVDDVELSLFCSETAALLKSDPKAVLEVQQTDEQRIKSQIAALNNLKSLTVDERAHRANLRAELDHVSPKVRQLEAAIRLLLTEEEVRSPWLIGPDWQGTAEVLRSLVSQVMRPQKSSREGTLSLKIRAPQNQAIVAWIDLPGNDRATFLARNKDYSPYYFLGIMTDLGGELAKRYALPAGIAAVVRYSHGFDVPLEKLKQEGAISIFNWTVEPT